MHIFAALLILLLSTNIAFAELNALEKYLRQEQLLWDKAYRAYGKECLQKIKAGELVPSDMAIDSMNCYIGKIHKFVKPHSMTKADLNILIDDWFANAIDHQEGAIDGLKSEKESIRSWKKYIKNRDKALKDIFAK